MPTIKRILFPVDFSGSCLGAARYVEAFAGRFEAEILLLHVVGMGEHNLAEDLLPSRRAQLESFFPAEMRRFPTVERCVVGDDPAEAILDAARRWSADLVMMPTRGLGVFHRMTVGSVTAKVLKGAECPVWTDVHAENVPPVVGMECRRVLCALGESERSQSVLEWAAWIAGQFSAPLAIVHATADIPASFEAGVVEEDLRQKGWLDARQRMEKLQLAAGTGSEVFYGIGDPAEAVARTAVQFGADLVVMGRYVETGWSFLQNSYAILRASPCPVISL